MVVDRGGLARRLLADFDAGTPVGPLAGPSGRSPDHAYALQAEVARLRECRGERVVGYKVGCTSREIQAQLGVEEPIFGRLFDSGCHPSGARLPSASSTALAIEGELAIRLSRDLPGVPLSEAESLGAIGSVFPVIELHHFDPTEGRPSLAALIASGGMHAGWVLPRRETKCTGAVPSVEGLGVAIDDHLVGTTAEPWTMGGPAATLRWLVVRLTGSGLQLRRGQVILTGSALPLFPVGPGSRIVAEARPLGFSTVLID